MPPTDRPVRACFRGLGDVRAAGPFGSPYTPTPAGSISVAAAVHPSQLILDVREGLEHLSLENW